LEVRKKLIEVALPLESINNASKRERNINHGHPSTLHTWWSRKPLAAARAVIFASLVDDPSSRPDLFPDLESQSVERERLLEFIRELVIWENSNNEEVLSKASAEILKSTDGVLPEFYDPFAGGGSLPLEAQRLGLTVQAGDLNPVAVMINKAMLEIPPRFAGRGPVSHQGSEDIQWHRAAGLAEDVEYYGKMMRNIAFERIGRLYPQVQLPGQEGSVHKANVVAWLWARTVKCPNPACGCHAPLVHSFDLSTKKGSEYYVDPVVKKNEVTYEIKSGKAKNSGTVSRNGAKCVVCQSPISFPYIREQGKNKLLKQSMLAIVAEGKNGKIFLPADKNHVSISNLDRRDIDFDQRMPKNTRDFKTPLYGIANFLDLFTSRQLLLLDTLGSVLEDLRPIIEKDALKAGFSADSSELTGGGFGAKAYSQAVTIYLSFIVDKIANFNSSICPWQSLGQKLGQTFGRQAIPMVWNFAEANPFSDSTGSLKSMTDFIAKCVRNLPASNPAKIYLADAQTDCSLRNILISTDPPYYDSVGYSDLSDFFYIWLRKSLKNIYNKVFSTILTPKTKELIASSFRFDGSSVKAKQYFEEEMSQVLLNLYLYCSENYPLTIYYAFKQRESEGQSDNLKMASSGWETMLSAIIKAGFTITGTWPIRTERNNRTTSLGTNSLASSIVLVCRKRPASAPSSSRRDFLRALKKELTPALLNLQAVNIAPVDMAQAAIGPGITIYSRYSGIYDADGTAVDVRQALTLINQELDNYFSEQEEKLDRDSSLCVAIFSQFGFDPFSFGEADVLARAKNTSVENLANLEVVEAKKGQVRLLTPK
jgi:putative DNA methylase